MEIFDDLGAETGRLKDILSGLDEAAWASPSAAAGWSVADVVLHLAQGDEAVASTLTGDGASALARSAQAGGGESVDAIMDAMVRAERDTPERIFARWQAASGAALPALREADPGRRVAWVAGTMKPATLATTRLAECWAHGLDITTPLGIPFPDTSRLRHIAWLAHSTLGYAFAATGRPAPAVRCELTAPDGEHVWEFGPADAASAIRGSAGEFCRVAEQRLPPEKSALQASGPDGAAALALLRGYAV